MRVEWFDLPLLVIFAFIVGSIIGSFLNVVIHRMPRGESVVFGGSRCPHCEAPIRWIDNIPILGWIVLCGRCRDCGMSISVRYLCIEFLFGVIVAGVAAGAFFLLV